MKEVEILARVKGGAEDALKKLSSICKFLQCIETRDHYFYEPKTGRFDLKKHGLEECLRIRVPAHHKPKLAYKKDIFDAALRGN